jgi:cytochrome c oxidase subunit 2
MAGSALTPAKLEKIFLVITSTMLLLFLGALFYAAFGLGMHLPDRAGEINPTQVRQTAPFDNPGVFQTGPNSYQVVALGMAWAFQPREIRVPAGAEITFVATATDVIHGFHVEGTKVNFMMIPGQISRVNAVFREPGEHLIICHEYCGAGHHLMSGKVIVVDAETFAAEAEAAAAEAAEAAAAAQTLETDAEVQADIPEEVEA